MPNVTAREADRSVPFTVHHAGPDARSQGDAYDALKDRAGDGDRAFRAGPLLRMLVVDNRRTIVVGKWRLLIAGGQISAEAHIRGVWTENGKEWRRDTVSDSIAAALEACRLRIPDQHAVDPQMAITLMAKTAAELSRNTVSELRGIRYQLESDLAERLRVKDGISPLPILSALIEIGTAVGQARDEARDAIREGLWLYLDDSEAYHRYRRAMDPTIMNDFVPADASTRPWMHRHDAAIRQCRAMEEQLSEEAAVLAGVLDATATISAAREADAQGRFNTLATAAALGLGLPSLVLAYYGADVLALSSWQQSAGLLPILAMTILAVVFARDHLPGQDRWRRWGWAIALVLAVVVVLGMTGWIAGWLAHGPTSSGS